MKYVDAYCDIAGASNPAAEPEKPCFYAHDGSTCTILRLRGTRTHLSEDEAMDRIVDAFKAISANLRDKAHALTITFEQSNNTKEEIDALIDPMRDASVRKGLDTASQLGEIRSILDKTVLSERILIAVWTYREAAVPAQIRNELAERRDSFGRIPFKGAVQNPLGPIQAMQAAHWGMVNSVQTALGLEGFTIETLGRDGKGRSDLAEVRRSLLFHETPPDWSPVMPGDVRYPKAKEKASVDISDLFAPTLDRQIMTSAVRGSKDLRTVEMGGRRYAVAHITAFPRYMTNFRALLSNIRGTGAREQTMPFRVAFHIEGGARVPPFKQILVKMGQLVSNTNKNISIALDGIAAAQQSDEETFVNARIYATTWTEPHEPEELLSDRRSKLVRALNGWQSPSVNDSSSDPLRLLVETAPGMTAVARTGLPSIAPVREMALALPFHSDAPTEHVGETIFTTMDGKAYPFKAHSPLQTSWLSLIWAPPGSGKSVLMNSMNMDFAANYPSSQLPYIGAIDIGVSSRGFIRTLQASLPPDKRNLVNFVRMQNDTNATEYFVNPFDIGLGRRFPLKREQSFIQNFFLALVGLGEIPELIALAEFVISTLYARGSDMTVSSTPKVWQEDTDHDLERRLKELGIDTHDDMTWWQVTDILAHRGEFSWAVRAQRYAMPALQDAVRILSEAETSKRFGDDLVRRVQTQVVSAINTFPCFSHATKMDIGEARVVSIDLDAVVHRVPNTDADRRANVLFFLMARELFVKKVAGEVGEVSLLRAPDEVLPVYQNYWTKKYSDIAQTRKRFCFDEFHICGSSPILAKQIDQDIRQGRKWGFEIVLASQRIGDFKDYIDLGSNIFVLKSDSEQDRKEMQRVLGVSDAVVEAVRRDVRGPNPVTGATFLIGRKMNSGESWLLVRFKIGPVRIWSLTTTMEDMVLRDKLYDLLGDVDRALQILATRFPSGSARDYWAQVAASAPEGLDIAMTIAERLLNEHMADSNLIG